MDIKATDKVYIINEGNYWRMVKSNSGGNWNIFYAKTCEEIYQFKMQNEIPVKKHSWIKFWKALQEERGAE